MNQNQLEVLKSLLQTTIKEIKEEKNKVYISTQTGELVYDKEDLISTINKRLKTN